MYRPVNKARATDRGKIIACIPLLYTQAARFHNGAVNLPPYFVFNDPLRQPVPQAEMEYSIPQHLHQRIFEKI